MPSCRGAAQRKVRPGDPLRFSATAYNKFVDAAIAANTRQFPKALQPAPMAPHLAGPLMTLASIR